MGPPPNVQPPHLAVQEARLLSEDSFPRTTAPRPRHHGERPGDSEVQTSERQQNDAILFALCKVAQGTQVRDKNSFPFPPDVKPKRKRATE